MTGRLSVVGTKSLCGRTRLEHAAGRSTARRAGFSLIELLVVILIIGLLIALLIPGVQAARNAARNHASKNNLRQISLAVHNFEARKGYYPPSWQTPDMTELNQQAMPPADVAGWSIHALLLPFLDQTVVSSVIDYDLPYNQGSGVMVTLADNSTVKLSSLRIPVYVSPGEMRDEPRLDSAGLPQHYPFNYAVNLGTWFVWDPVTKKGGYGAAFPNSRLRDSDFSDGTGMTLCFAEVKSWQPYYRNGNSTALSPLLPPATIADICALPNDGTLRDSGHTEWVDGRCHHSGFTTVFGPNEKVLCAGTLNGVAGTYDVDWNNHQEGVGLNDTNTANDIATYAAVTARSYFSGQVNVSMMDGSVRAVNDEIHIGVWRALSTRAGKELLPDEFSKR